MVIAKCIKVRKELASELIKRLKVSKLISDKLLVKREGDYVLIPIKADPNSGVISELLKEFNAELLESDFKYSLKGLTYKDLLIREGLVPRNVIDSLPRSFEVIGDVAVIKVRKVSNELLRYGRYVANAVMSISRNVSSVYIEVPGLETDFRVRRLMFLGGTRKTSTIHKEYGIRIYVEIDKVYFNPSLSEEHHRIANYVRDGEVIADLFCGVGPFSLHIASRANCVIYAVDLNPEAIKCLIKSLELNRGRLKGYVVPVNSDVKYFLNILGNEVLDRAIMNLPHKAINYLRHVWPKVRLGGTVHLYVIGHNAEEVRERVVTKVINECLGNALIKDVVKVLDYAPHKYVFRVTLVRKS